ncbi:hypothetical protein BC829DRAFT_398187 [Chytridium lagenaria]|nr:hypothetical protein BC829DRAFT_398187 [Chytridium lagenaria]
MSFNVPPELLRKLPLYGDFELLTALSSTCKRLRQLLWGSPQAMANAFMSTYNGDIQLALKNLLDRTRDYSLRDGSRLPPEDDKYKNGHPLGGDFELAIVQSLVGSHTITDDTPNLILMKAARNLDLKMCTYLLSIGANANYALRTNDNELERRGFYPGHTYDDPNLAVAKLLLEHGASLTEPEVLNSFWQNALHGDDISISYFIRFGMKVDVVDESDPHSPTALIKACSRNPCFLPKVQILLDAGADPNLFNGQALKGHYFSAFYYKHNIAVVIDRLKVISNSNCQVDGQWARDGIRFTPITPKERLKACYGVKSDYWIDGKIVHEIFCRKDRRRSMTTRKPNLLEELLLAGGRLDPLEVESCKGVLKKESSKRLVLMLKDSIRSAAESIPNYPHDLGWLTED